MYFKDQNIVEISLVLHQKHSLVHAFTTCS